MLVVVAIIMMLAAMIFPALEAALGKAEATSCVANMRHLGMAARLYADDYDGRIVPAMLPHPDAAGVSWEVTIQPYVRNRQILLCPSDESPRKTHGAVSEPHSYGINLELAQVGGYFGSSLLMSSMDDPVGTILLCELNGERFATNGVRYESEGLEKVAVRRHGIGSDYTFVDGHTKWLRGEQTVEPELLWDP